jgi:soluble lytic murein transglycosylase-like protein
VTVAAVESAEAAAGTGAQAAIARIAELQQLVARAHGVEQPDSASLSGGASFSSALAGAGAQASAATALPPFGSPAFGAAPPAAGFGSNIAASGAPLAPGSGGLGGEPSPFDGLILASAQRNGVDPALLKGLIRAESGFDPSAGSGAGAVGLVQLMPGTAASLGVTDPTDPAQSIEGGAKYLRQQLDAFGGDVSKALAAYNAGPGAVRRYDGVPPYAETQAYVQKVQAYADEYRVPAATAFAPPPAVPAAYAPQAYAHQAYAPATYAPAVSALGGAAVPTTVPPATFALASLPLPGSTSFSDDSSIPTTGSGSIT